MTAEVMICACGAFFHDPAHMRALGRNCRAVGWASAPVPRATVLSSAPQDATPEAAPADATPDTPAAVLADPGATVAPKRGGARPGSGPKPRPELRRSGKRLVIRLRAGERAQLDAVGAQHDDGTAGWARGVLLAAAPKKP